MRLSAEYLHKKWQIALLPITIPLYYIIYFVHYFLLAVYKALGGRVEETK